MNEDARNEVQEEIEVKTKGSFKGNLIAFGAGAVAFGVGMLIAKCRSKKAESDYLEEDEDGDLDYFEDEGALEEVLEAAEKESEEN